MGKREGDRRRINEPNDLSGRGRFQTDRILKRMEKYERKSGAKIDRLIERSRHKNISDEEINPKTDKKKKNSEDRTNKKIKKINEKENLDDRKKRLIENAESYKEAIERDKKLNKRNK